MKLICLMSDRDILNHLNDDSDTRVQIFIRSKSEADSTLAFSATVLSKEIYELSDAERIYTQMSEEIELQNCEIVKLSNELKMYRTLCSVVGGERILNDLVRQYKTYKSLSEKNEVTP